MPRELENLHDHLMEVKAKFGEIQLIPLKLAAEWLGLDVRTLHRDKSFPVKKVAGRYYVPAANLARWLCR